MYRASVFDGQGDVFLHSSVPEVKFLFRVVLVNASMRTA